MKIKGYECPTCKKMFGRRESLEYHMYTRKRKCTGYEKYTNTSINATSGHTQKQIKPIDNTNTKVNLAIPADDTLGTKESEHICTYCNKTFARKDILTRHINKYCKVHKQIIQGGGIQNTVVNSMIPNTVVNGMIPIASILGHHNNINTVVIIVPMQQATG